MLDSARQNSILTEIESIIADEAKIKSLVQLRFNEADIDNSGTIDTLELGIVFKNLSLSLGMIEPTLDQVNELFKKLDVDSSGEIDQTEFAQLIRASLFDLFKFHLENIRGQNQEARRPSRIRQQDQNTSQKEQEEADSKDKKAKYVAERKACNQKAKEAAENQAKRQQQIAARKRRVMQKQVDPNAQNEARQRYANLEEEQAENERKLQELAAASESKKSPPKKFKQTKPVDEQDIQRYGQEQLGAFNKYLEDTSLNDSMQLIFTEIITKNIDEKLIFAYAAKRFRQLGAELGYYN